jgi:hypothetical protein
MGLKEILAAKKAAAEQAEVKESSNEVATQEKAILAPASAPPASIPVQVNLETSKEELPLVDANGKPLSGFALVKRRKELAAQAAQNPAKVEDKTATPTINRMVAEGILQEAKPDETGTVLPVVTATTIEVPQSQEESPSHAAFLEASPETKQAYSDLKVRIDSLVSLADIDLKNAMTELKKALMQNTNAVALMLPSDIGQMVIALRKMTGVELAKAEEKKTGKKTGKKEPALTAEELENAFKEL